MGTVYCPVKYGVCRGRTAAGGAARSRRRASSTREGSTGAFVENDGAVVANFDLVWFAKKKKRKRKKKKEKERKKKIFSMLNVKN